MTRKIYIYPGLNQTKDAELWLVDCLVTDSSAATGKVQQTTLDKIKTELESAELVLIIPADQVLLTQVTLPGKSQARLKQALPYALEDQLIYDVETQYFILGPKLAEQTYAVAVIDRDYLNNILSSLNTNEIYPDVVLPESLLIPGNQNHWVIVQRGQQAILRYGDQQGSSCDMDSLPLILNSLLSNAEQLPEVIEVYADNPQELSNFSQVKLKSLPENIISLMYHDHAAMQMNLLPAAFRRRERLNIKYKKWLPAVAMLTVWLLFQFGSNVHTYIDLKQQDKKLQQSLEQVYRQAFPDARKIVNVEVQMRQRLEELRKQRGTDSNGFAEMIVSSAPLLKQAPGIKLHALRYQQGKMDIELEIASLKALEQLKEKLTASGKWQVEIKSASAKDKSVEGRLQITGRQS